MKKEENKLTFILKQYRETGNIELRNRLIEHFIPKAQKIAKSYTDLGIELQDLFSFAYIGLIEGVEKLKNSNNPNYLLSISVSINNNLKINIASTLLKTDSENISDTYKNRLIKILIAKRDLKKHLKRLPSQEEISEYTGLSIDVISKILNDISKESITDFIDAEIDDKIMSKAINLEEQIIIEEEIRSLYNILNASYITKYEKRILTLRYLSGRLKTYEEISNILGCKKQNIQQIELRTLSKIKDRII